MHGDYFAGKWQAFFGVIREMSGQMTLPTFACRCGFRLGGAGMNQRNVMTLRCMASERIAGISAEIKKSSAALGEAQKSCIEMCPSN